MTTRAGHTTIMTCGWKSWRPTRGRRNTSTTAPARTTPTGAVAPPLGDGDAPFEGTSGSVVVQSQFDPVRPAGQFQRGHRIGNGQGMLHEEARHAAPASPPVELAGAHSVLAFQQLHSLIAETANHRSRTSTAVIDLRPWAIQVTVVIKELQAAEDLLTTARGEGKEVRREEKAVLKDTANCLPVPWR